MSIHTVRVLELLQAAARGRTVRPSTSRPPPLFPWTADTASPLQSASAPETSDVIRCRGARYRSACFALPSPSSGAWPNGCTAPKLVGR
jgi:hypothetical protein